MRSAWFSKAVAGLAVGLAGSGVLADSPAERSGLAWIDVTGQIAAVATVSGAATVASPVVGFLADSETSAGFNLWSYRPGFLLILR